MNDRELMEALLTGNSGKKQAGFEPDPQFKEPCFHLSHRPPTGMVIPRGQRYRHVCPGCGEETVIRSINVTC
uniref:Uncharacterized protein n=1 Tax=Pseudomonas phage HRDY3 TaxID=3236930 RepID=A0AB39CDF9_9VIRU